MKTKILSLLLLSLSYFSFAQTYPSEQSDKKVPKANSNEYIFQTKTTNDVQDHNYPNSYFTLKYLEFNDPGAFKRSPAPLINGYGEYSDSLSKTFSGKTFYEYNEEYYIIESWADYYYWFTKKYWYEFDQPEIYEFYYLTDNSYGMASYICSKYYLAQYYPSHIRIDFLDLNVELNRLKDERYFAQKLSDLKKHHSNIEITKETPKKLNYNSLQKVKNEPYFKETKGSSKETHSGKSNKNSKENTSQKPTKLD